MSKSIKITSWVLSLLGAGLLLSTVPFKLSGAEESVAIFTQLGVEPFGRIGLGVVELLAGIAMLVPATRALGAGFVAALMMGALGSHVAVLGFAGENASLAAMAVVILICSVVVAYLHRQQLPGLARA